MYETSFIVTNRQVKHLNWAWWYFIVTQTQWRFRREVPLNHLKDKINEKTNLWRLNGWIRNNLKQSSRLLQKDLKIAVPQHENQSKKHCGSFVHGRPKPKF